MANYLTRHGTGLVELIITHRGIDSGARWTSREQPVLHDKLIIALGDEDLLQMLVSYRAEASCPK